ncbi:DUF4286 family protein [Beijerinckia sp. L45]|uniref:DUF4286 family protein n=1 Tax=Beijerinckia sp. L45 TaxID=1641855 RepID=UPI00131BDED9|nr:DUF4286 family protein [Beijerinckia sp. L45]
MQGTSILFSEMTPPVGQESRFHDWYNEEHIPLRMDVPGFLSAQRYRDLADDARGYLAVYEMTDPAVMASSAYQVVKTQPSDTTREMLSTVSGFTRYIGAEMGTRRQPGLSGAQALDAAVLYAVWFEVPESALPDFDAWYDLDHVPLLLGCKDWLMVRRFHILDGEPTKANRLALHYLADRSALEAPERAAARATPWRKRLAALPWFAGTYSVFEKHGPRQIGRLR